MVTAATDTLIGTVVDGRFEIRDKLGQGGMGAVYRAWQRSTEREIAVKLIAKNQTGEAMAVERFLREAKLASQLSHPNTISVYDFGKLADGRLFIAMELLRGQTLGRILKTQGALEPDRIVRIAIQICDALAAAHALKIVHRDLKPDNVMLIDNTADLVKVLDFGLAKRLDDKGVNSTAAGLVVGTPRYIPPEAMMTGANYAEGDLYALGVMIGEMALGRPLWPSSSLVELVKIQLKPADYIRDIREPLRAVVASLLDPTPAMRPTAAQLRAQLVAMQSGALPAYRPPQPAPALAQTAPPTMPATPAAKIPETPTGLTRVHPRQRANSPTANAEGSPWARPQNYAPPAMPERPRTPSAKQRPHAPDQQRAEPPPAPPARPRWIPWVAAGAALAAAAAVVAMVSNRGSSSQTATTPTQAKPVAQAVAPIDAAPSVEVPGDAALEAAAPDEPSAPSIGGAARTPATAGPTQCTALRDEKAKWDCLYEFCMTHQTDPYCGVNTAHQAVVVTSYFASKECIRLQATDTKDAARCQQAFCMRYPYSSFCDVEVDPDIHAPGAKGSTVAKKPPPPAAKKTTPAKKNDDLVDPFADQGKTAKKKRCDTCLERPD